MTRMPNAKPKRRRRKTMPKVVGDSPSRPGGAGYGAVSTAGRVAPSPQATRSPDDAFGTFTEWQSDADAAAYRNL